MTTSTLTWQSSGLATKTGTSMTAYFTDFAAMVNSKLGDANFAWQVAASNLGATPFWVNLKRKDGSPGRILFIAWTTNPGVNNPVLLDTTPQTANTYLAFFPNGNVDTPSNLTTAGVVMGNDTDCTKVGNNEALASAYTTSTQLFYFDSPEAIYIGTQNPAAAVCKGMGAGYLVVDANDNAYPSVLGFGTGTAQMESWGISGGNFPSIPWTTAGVQSGSSGSCVRIVAGGVSRAYFMAYQPTGIWANQAVSSVDILTETATNRAWFVPTPLLGLLKGEGLIYKMRQMGWGPGAVGPFQVYNTTGPIVQARQFNARTAGGNGYPWLTNFKI